MRDDPVTLRALAARCRRLAGGCTTEGASSALEEIALGYDGRADEAEAADEERRGIMPAFTRGT